MAAFEVSTEATEASFAAYQIREEKRTSEYYQAHGRDHGTLPPTVRAIRRSACL